MVLTPPGFAVTVRQCWLFALNTQALFNGLVLSHAEQFLGYVVLELL
jgi:hypothetical protein